jgi:hypothetical protein
MLDFVHLESADLTQYSCYINYLKQRSLFPTDFGMDVLKFEIGRSCYGNSTLVLMQRAELQVTFVALSFQKFILCMYDNHNDDNNNKLSDRRSKTCGFSFKLLSNKFQSSLEVCPCNHTTEDYSKSL